MTVPGRDAARRSGSSRPISCGRLREDDHPASGLQCPSGRLRRRLEGAFGFLRFHQGTSNVQRGLSLPASRQGLASDEVPALLQTGEAVLSRDQVRRAGEGGEGGGGFTVINAVDGQSFLEEALRVRAGQETLLNTIQANRGAVRSILGVT